VRLTEPILAVPNLQTKKMRKKPVKTVQSPPDPLKTDLGVLLLHNETLELLHGLFEGVLLLCCGGVRGGRRDIGHAYNGVQAAEYKALLSGALNNKVTLKCLKILHRRVLENIT
jgi:hypothetical protein